MSVDSQSRTYDLIERLVLGRITADNWADARLRQALYSAIRTKLAASDADPEQLSRYQAALAVVSENVEASAKVATGYEDFIDLKAAARAETLSPRSGAPVPPPPRIEPPSVAKLPHIHEQAPVAAIKPEPPAIKDQPDPPSTVSENRIDPPQPERTTAVQLAPSPTPSTAATELPITRATSFTKGSQPNPAKTDDRPVRTIPLWLIMGAVALAALAYAFWPRGASCTLRSTTCVTERVVTAGSGLTEQEVRLLRFAIVNVQSTPTHVFARVRIQNTGSRPVPAVSPNPFRLAFRLRPTTQSADTLRLEQFSPNRIDVPQDIAPGATIEVPLLAVRPAGTAGLALELTFVVELRFWAFQIGIEPFAVPVP